MSSVVRGSGSSDLEFVAGTGRTVKFTTDALGTINIASLATQGFVTSQINAVINAAPGALDTLDELSAALGDDANFAVTITNALATKAASSDVYTKTQVDTALGLKATAASVYTQSEVNTLLNGYTTTGALTTALASKQDKFVEVPTSSIGQLGDTAGMIAINNSYIFYCTADYTDGNSDIWARVALTLESW